MISTHPAREIRATISSTYPRQRVADEHVYHAGAAELGVHHDHPCWFFAYLTDDGGLFSSVHVPQGFEGSVSRVGGDYGEELAFVGDVERVYAEYFARPVHDVPDRE